MIDDWNCNNNASQSFYVEYPYHRRYFMDRFRLLALVLVGKKISKDSKALYPTSLIRRHLRCLRLRILTLLRYPYASGRFFS